MKSLAAMLGIDENDPVYLEAKRKAREKYGRGAADHSCPNGCVNYIDPETGEYLYGYGPAGCSTPICNGNTTSIHSETGDDRG